MTKITAIIVKIIEYVLADFLETFLSSISIEPPVIAALTTMATNKEADKVTVNVIGKYFMNLPIVPGQRAKGRNAIKVVAVEEITGQAISPIPILDASTRLSPFFILANTLSTTTIPSSTSIPSPITNPKSTMVFKVSPNADRILKAINMDRGIAAPTNKEFLSPIVNINTIITNTIPKIMWLGNSSTWCSTRDDWSFVNSIFKLDGK
ncbi:hypothetical protein D3C80_1234350 [compost metagenome]